MRVVVRVVVKVVVKVVVRVVVKVFVRAVVGVLPTHPKLLSPKDWPYGSHIIFIATNQTKKQAQLLTHPTRHRFVREQNMICLSEACC